MMRFQIIGILSSCIFLLLAGCGNKTHETRSLPVDSALVVIDCTASPVLFDPYSDEYRKKFYDSILGPVDSVDFMNPTGTYHFGPYTSDGAGEPIGNQGDVRVKSLGHGQISICLSYVSHGPGFNVGYLFDTLEYRNNSAAYHGSYDESCTVTFRFDTNGVEVKQFSNEPGFACDFGHNVYVDGYYNKESDDILNIDDDCY